MINFLSSIALFWGFILFFVSLFCVTNLHIASKVIQNTFKKILFMGSIISLVMFAFGFLNFMISSLEIFALSIVSSCWLVDILNKARYRFDPEYNNLKFFIYDIVWGLSMFVMFCLYLVYTFTGDFNAILTVVKIIILMAAVVGSAFGSQKILDTTI